MVSPIQVKESIANSLDKIMEALMNYNLSTDLSLYTGSSGVIFSLMHQARTFNNSQYYNKAFELLEASIQGLYNTSIPNSFAGGITGFAWLLNYLIKYDLIETDSEEMLQDIDSQLKNYLASLDFETRHDLDFLHGLQGIAFYFLSRENNENVLDLILTHIEKQAIPEPDGSIKWIFTNRLFNTSSYNLSLSHGIASIIALLLRFMDNGVHMDRVKSIMDGAIKYLLKFKQDHEFHFSFFPNVVSLENGKTTHVPSQSRLAWCYGDLGIAYQLYDAGQVTKNQPLIDFSLEVLLHSAGRRNQSDHQVMDAGLCHGAAGNVLLFKRIFEKTSNDRFREAAEFWLNQTLNYAKFTEGLAGYRLYDGTSRSYRSADHSFLEGIGGIAMVLSSELSMDKELPWYECLLL